ncbi:hypothetical protein D3C71_479420 [compost metagenome]
MQPAAQQAATHRCHRAVEHAEQSIAGIAVDAGVQLQMATRCRVHRDRFAGGLHRDGRQVRQALLLGFLDITEQGAGSGRGARLVVDAEAAEVVQLEEVQQLAATAVGVEQPRRAATHAAALAQELGPVLFIRHQQFGRFQTRQFGFQCIVSVDFVDQEAAAGQVGPGQPIAALVARQGHQQSVAALIQQRLVGNGARGDDAHHLAFDQALGQCRVADLFADRHRFAQRDQSCQVALVGVHRHAGHRNRCTTGAAALGQGDVEQARGLARVVVEQLVEVAHAEEQQQVRIVGLGCEELLHQRRVFGGLVFGHGTRGSGASARAGGLRGGAGTGSSMVTARDPGRLDSQGDWGGPYEQVPWQTRPVGTSAAARRTVVRIVVAAGLRPAAAQCPGGRRRCPSRSGSRSAHRRVAGRPAGGRWLRH